MKILVSVIVSLFCITGLSASWAEPQKIDKNFKPECYAEKHIISKDKINTGHI